MREKIMPSRNFLIQQATLTAAAKMFPQSAASGRLGWVLRDLRYDQGRAGEAEWPNTSTLFRAVRAEYRRLADRYQVAA
jgi:hypothetical protein